MKCSGITLVECTVYLAVSALLFSYLFSHVAAMYTNVMNSMQAAHHLMVVASAMSVLRHDIQEARMIVQESPDQLIIRTSDVDHRWFLNETRLVRVQGHFDEMHRTWHPRRTVTLAQSCSNFFAVIECRFGMTMVKIVLTYYGARGKYTMEQIALCRNQG
jgi:hypothetical protein